MESAFKNKFQFLGLFLLCILTFVCTASQCTEESDEKPITVTINLLNNSEESIFVGYYKGANVITPATVFMRYGMNGVAEIAPGSRFNAFIEYLEAYPPTGYYQFIVFKKSTIENHTLPELMEESIFDARYIYTLAEFKQMGNEIVFDGKEQ